MSTKSHPKMSTKCHPKRGLLVDKSVHEMSPLLSTRCHLLCPRDVCHPIWNPLICSTVQSCIIFLNKRFYQLRRVVVRQQLHLGGISCPLFVGFFCHFLDNWKDSFLLQFWQKDIWWFKQLRFALLSGKKFRQIEMGSFLADSFVHEVKPEILNNISI